MKTEWDSDHSRQNYETMQRLTNGVAHLIITTIPPKILKVINFLGIGGSETRGWTELEWAAFESSGMFSQLARMYMIFHWSYMEPHFYNGAMNLDRLHDVLAKELNNYPKVKLYSFCYFFAPSL